VENVTKRISQLKWLLCSTVSVSGHITGKHELIWRIQVFRDVTLCGWESGSWSWQHHNPLKHQDYTSENMAQFYKILVRTQNVAEVTVAPPICGTQEEHFERISWRFSFSSQIGHTRIFSVHCTSVEQLYRTDNLIKCL
jgi:hypothetical protein